MAGTVYALTGVAGLCVGGSAVKGDVLSNLNIDFVAAALWGNVPLACGFVATVKVTRLLLQCCVEGAVSVDITALVPASVCNASSRGC